MTESIGGPSAPYNATIPSITDNADIQTALRLYHYGSDTSTPTVIPEESIAGHLNILQNAKIDKTPTTIPGSANLNTYTTTGYYAQTSNSFAASGTNYPAPYAGMLTVTNSGSSIFQQYQVVGAAESGSANAINRTHWRFYFAGSWKPWRTFVDSSDFATLGDSRYYTQSVANATFASLNYSNSTFFTKTEADAAQYVQEVSVTDPEYTLKLSDAGKVVVASNTSNATAITVPTSSVAFPIGTIINVYSTTPRDVVVVGAVGVTLRPFLSNSLKLFGQYTEISLRKRSTNEWVASGNVLQN